MLEAGKKTDSWSIDKTQVSANGDMGVADCGMCTESDVMRWQTNVSDDIGLDWQLIASEQQVVSCDGRWWQVTGDWLCKIQMMHRIGN